MAIDPVKEAWMRHKLGKWFLKTLLVQQMSTVSIQTNENPLDFM
jgi:hypothetical protein